jgi:hypothetical protein
MKLKRFRVDDIWMVVAAVRYDIWVIALGLTNSCL